MRGLILGIITLVVIHIGGCGIGAGNVVVVEASPISMQYTSQQIRDYLRRRGYERAYFKDYENDMVVKVKRSAYLEEMRFRLKAYPDIRIRTVFEKKKSRVWLYFSEKDHPTLSEFGRKEYDWLINQLTAQLGEDRVRAR
jgi:hypothetical protein